jgi:hypothetical protein
VFETKALTHADGKFVGVDGGHSSCDAVGAEAASERYCGQLVRETRRGMGFHDIGPFRTAARWSRLWFSVHPWGVWGGSRRRPWAAKVTSTRPTARTAPVCATPKVIATEPTVWKVAYSVRHERRGGLP